MHSKTKRYSKRNSANIHTLFILHVSSYDQVMIANCVYHMIIATAVIPFTVRATPGELYSGIVVMQVNEVFSCYANHFFLKSVLGDFTMAVFLRPKCEASNPSYWLQVFFALF